MVIPITEIILIAKQGKKVLLPFTVNSAETIVEEGDEIINSFACDPDNSEFTEVGEQTGN